MTLPLSSPFTSLTKVTKAQLDQLVAAINSVYGLTSPNPLPQHYLVNTAGTSIANNTDQTITGWTVNSAANVGALTSGSRTITVAGMYVITANILFPLALPAGTYIHSTILVNGVVVANDNTLSITGHASSVAPTQIMPLAVGDQVAVTVNQNSGSAQPLSTGAGGNSWSLAWQGYV